MRADKEPGCEESQGSSLESSERWQRTCEPRRGLATSLATGVVMSYRDNRLPPATPQIQKWDIREWFNSRKRAPPPPPLHPAVVRVIEQWFQLVDDDGGGTLDHAELLGALRVRPCSQALDPAMGFLACLDTTSSSCLKTTTFSRFALGP